MVYDKLNTFPREVFENLLEDMLKASGTMNLYASKFLLILNNGTVKTISIAQIRYYVTIVIWAGSSMKRDTC